MSEKQLAPPGAGLPLIQALFVRFIGSRIANASNWETNRKNFNSINQKILSQIKGLSETQLTKKILVPPQRGLEDSSRFWSVAMTLEHLTIVGTHIVNGIIDLSQGVIPPIEVDTAKVKPLGQMNPHKAVLEFENFVKTADTQIESGVKDRDSKAKLTHPWFGPMRALQWQWLLGTHSAIHSKQIKEILKQIK